MNQKTWTAVDEYMTDLLVPTDPSLEAALKANEAANLPAIDVAPNQGKFLHLLAQMNGAKRILEIGTLGGYSTIWMAKALPADGKLVTLEYEPKHAEVALSNIEKAGYSNLVELRKGEALDSLQQLHDEGQEPFDLIFIDADKENNPHYFQWALTFSKKGTLIIVDNVVRDGEVVNANSNDERVHGVRRMFELMAQEARVSTTAIQTVGSKGYDGLSIALVIK
ncbi:O-methyltransferase [Bacillus horti]|uniref:O-methyltransferase YrrM n=1 Tax=Caldalkalibacillus horti TaxID=77523 RepID=A0ABT9W3F2_9BACI|nr:O-methyltransferase [Bacillus horti]MDQ0167757.1 putative O-methyltransferase YrrM [Bacillus horti]